jgi:hypothetical protein
MVQPVTDKEPTMTITITHPERASRRARYAAIVALSAVAATMIGYWGAQTMTDDPAMTVTSPADLDVSAQVADWARANGVVGLSPASATASADLDVSTALADWARANAVVGLSPASATASADLDVSTALADWARANGVVGLSPASASAPTPA